MQMKNKALIGALACGVIAFTYQANADLFWDGADTTADADGGAGTWDTTASNWDDLAVAGTNTTWDSNIAVFGPAGDIVTLGENITANQLYFNTGGYTFNSGGGDTITLGASGGKRETSNIYLDETGTNTFNVNFNNNGNLFTVSADRGSNRIAVISGNISGSGGFETFQGARVTLSGDNTYTGKTRINADTTTGSQLTVSSFNSVNGGTPLLASSSLGAPTTVANGTIEIGNSGKRASSTLIYTGSGETTDRVINPRFNSSSKQTITANGGGLLKFTSDFVITRSSGNVSSGLILRGTGSGEIAGNLGALPGFLEKEDTGTWTIGGDITVDRAIVDRGTLNIGGLLNPNDANTGTTTNTGNVVVNTNGTLNLLDDSVLSFIIEGAGVNNALVGSGTASLDGDLLLDLTGASTTLSDSWNVVDVASLTESFGGTFLVRSTLGSFTESGGVWSIAENGAAYEFDESTGVLTVVVIPEPSSLALLGLGGLLVARRRRG